MEIIEIRPPFIKLEQFLKLAGICDTGGQAKLMILNKSVLVNNDICTMRGKKLRNGDKVQVKDIVNSDETNFQVTFTQE